MNILLRRLDVGRSIDWGLVNIANLAEAPSGNVGEILLSHLNSINEQRLTNVLRRNTHVFH
jgi:hypothetical protein